MTSSEDRTPSPTTSADTSATPPSTQATSSPPTPPTTTAKPASESPKVYSYSPPPSPNLLPQEQSQRAPILIPPEVAAWPTFICYPSLMRAHWYHGLRVPLSAEAYDDVVSLVAEIVASGAPAPVHATALAFGTQVARSRVADKALRRVHVQAPRETGRLLIHEIIEDEKEEKGIEEAHHEVVGGGSGSR